MQIKFDTWKKQLVDFGDDTKGNFKLVKRPSFGYGADYFAATINYKENEINILQSATKINIEVDLSPLILEYCMENSVNLTLSINQRDFFDRIFSGASISSGNKNFDKKYTIKSSDSRLALSLFKEERVQFLFLEHPLLIFNVLNEQGKTIIRMKNMAKKLYSKEEMLYYFEEFNFIVSKVLE